MKLPEHIRYCIDALEQAGFATYAVGGCVRDSLLGLDPHDYDLCTAATPEQIKAVFSRHRLVLSGEKHGTVAVILEQPVEITTFRTEGSYTDSRHPDWVQFVTDIEADLSRRDFTVNAMAYSPSRGFADPFGGREDLQNKRLRAVGDPSLRFTEDALRILRGVRFAVRYGLQVEPETKKAMLALAQRMDNLARERVFEELCKLLPLVSANHLLEFAPILAQVIPELQPCIDFDQHSPHHAYDVFTHTAHVVEGVSPELALRWAALLHDVGKPAVFYQDETGRGHFPDHAAVGAEMADALLRRLRASNALRERVVMLIRHHMTPMPPERTILRRRLSKFGDDTWSLLALQKADFFAKGVPAENDFAQTEAILQDLLQEQSCLSLKDLALNGSDLMALGFSGKAVGLCLNHLLNRVLEETIPNEKSALLNEAEHYREEII